MAVQIQFGKGVEIKEGDGDRLARAGERFKAAHLRALEEEVQIDVNRAVEIYRDMLTLNQMSPQKCDQIIEICDKAEAKLHTAAALAIRSRALVRKWVMTGGAGTELIYKALEDAREAERLQPSPQNEAWRGHVLNMSIQGLPNTKRLAKPPAGFVVPPQR